MAVITFFFCQNTGHISKGSSAIVIDCSNSEGIVCVRSESTSCEGPIHYHYRDQSPSHFLEFHCVVVDWTIMFNASDLCPGHTNTSGGERESVYVWGSSRCCSRANFQHDYKYNLVYTYVLWSYQLLL